MRRHPGLVPYVGAGIGSYAYKETSEFVDDLSVRHVGYLVTGGIEARIQRWIADAGVENVDAHVDALMERGVLRRLLAFTELKFSNSMIEAWWRSTLTNTTRASSLGVSRPDTGRDVLRHWRCGAGGPDVTRGRRAPSTRGGQPIGVGARRARLSTRPHDSSKLIAVPATDPGRRAPPELPLATRIRMGSHPSTEKAGSTRSPERTGPCASTETMPQKRLLDRTRRSLPQWVGENSRAEGQNVRNDSMAGAIGTPSIKEIRRP